MFANMIEQIYLVIKTREDSLEKRSSVEDDARVFRAQGPVGAERTNLSLCT